MRHAYYRRTRPGDARSDPHSGRVVILGDLLRKLLDINVTMRTVVNGWSRSLRRPRKVIGSRPA